MLLYRNHVAILLLLPCLVLLPTFSLAQSTVAPETSITAEILQGRIQEVEASTGLDEANKSALLDLYRKSLGLVKQRVPFQDE